MPSGINAETFTKIIPGGAKLYVGATMYGTTRGPGAFDKGETIRNVPFDGKVADVSGLDRIVYRLPTITVTLLELTAAKIAALTPGSTTATVGAVTEITPGAAQVFLTALTDVRLIWKQADNTFIGIRFSKARAEMRGLGGGGADDEATSEAVFTGLVLGTSDTTLHASPYKWELGASEAVILANP
jgi:hypothetical protein